MAEANISKPLPSFKDDQSENGQGRSSLPGDCVTSLCYNYVYNIIMAFFL